MGRAGTYGIAELRRVPTSVEVARPVLWHIVAGHVPISAVNAIASAGGVGSGNRRRRTGLLVTIGFVALGSSSCSNASEEVSGPAGEPRAEFADHGGELCPEALPTESAADAYASSAPQLFDPERAWTCAYELRSGTWERVSRPRMLDEQDVETLRSVVQRLAPFEDDQGRNCPLDLGPRVLLAYTHGDDLTGLVMDRFGCHALRLTDEPFTTPPGEPTQEGTVRGALQTPDELLSADAD